MASIRLLLLNILLWNICESANIIAVMPIPSFSHQIVFQPLWKKLLLRGHQITLLTTEPIKDTNFSNLTQVDWSFANELLHNKHNYSNIIKNFRENKIKSFNQYINTMHDIVSQELAVADVQKLINDHSKSFDIAIIEFLHPTMLAFSERFNCPYIGVSSMDTTSFAHEMVGNPTNPAVYTDFLASYDSQMSFYERILNTLHYIFTSLYFNLYMYPKEDITIKNVFGNNFPKLKDIQKKVSMVFLNTNPVLHDVRPLVPNVLQIGGAIHIHKLNDLPQDMENFLNGHKNGVIYFSLGSNVKLSDLPKASFNALLETFTNSSYGIIWKTDEQKLTKDDLSNIYAANWLPQQEILAHKNVKLFITQGGQQSLEEAIYYGVPVIGLPFYVDQFANIRRLARKNACIALDPQHLRREDLQSAIQEVLTNEKYSTSIKEMSALLKDRPISSVDQAVWWTEYVIRHKGAKFLKSEVPQMPFYQYYLLDVIGLFIFIFVIIISIQYMFIKYLIKYIRYRMKDHKSYKFE